MTHGIALGSSKINTGLPFTNVISDFLWTTNGLLAPAPFLFGSTPLGSVGSGHPARLATIERFEAEGPIGTPLGQPFLSCPDNSLAVYGVQLHAVSKHWSYVSSRLSWTMRAVPLTGW